MHRLEESYNGVSEVVLPLKHSVIITLNYRSWECWEVLCTLRLQQKVGVQPAPHAAGTAQHL